MQIKKTKNNSWKKGKVSVSARMEKKKLKGRRERKKRKTKP